MTAANVLSMKNQQKVQSPKWIVSHSLLFVFARFRQSQGSAEHCSGSRCSNVNISASLCCFLSMLLIVLHSGTALHKPWKHVRGRRAGQGHFQAGETWVHGGEEGALPMGGWTNYGAWW